jgi:hypothetical protein
MSEAIELYKQDGTAAGVFFCSECRAVFPNQGQAQGCHGERLCTCGKKIERRFYAKCDACSSVEWQERRTAEERARFDAAKKIAYADYGDGMIYDGDKYFDDVEALKDHYFDSPVPAYVWACKDVGIPKLQLDDVIEPLFDGMWEEADANDLHGTVDLDLWEPDYSTVILLEPSHA